MRTIGDKDDDEEAAQPLLKDTHDNPADDQSPMPGSQREALLEVAVAHDKPHRQCPTRSPCCGARAPGETDDEEAWLTLLQDQNTRPYFKVLAPITLREVPRIDGDRTGEVLKVGEVIQAKDIVTLRKDGFKVHWDHAPLDHTCFVHLEKHRGWAVSRNIMTEELLLEPVQGPDGVNRGCRATLYHVFQGSPFEYAIILVVLLNAIAIGAEIDYGHSFPASAWKAINYVFAGIYVMELSLKLFAFGVRTFFESWWNIFDFAITVTTITSDVLPLLMPGVPMLGAVAPVLRLLRLLRLARIFRDIRTLLRSFASSVGALCWIGVFTGLWFYICACICTVFVGSKRWMREEDVPGAAELRAKFSSIPMSMYTLFEVMTMEGFTDVLRPLVQHRPLLVIFFGVFIFVSGFFLLNLVTAVVVDRTLASQEEDSSSKDAAEADDLGRIVYDLRAYFMKQNDGQDIVERSKLTACFNDKYVKTRFNTLSWDRNIVQGACSILDKDGAGTLSISQLMNLFHGSVRPLDAYTMLRMQADMTIRMEQQEQMIKQAMELLQRIDDKTRMVQAK